MKAIRLSYKEILDIFPFDPPRHLDFKKILTCVLLSVQNQYGSNISAFCVRKAPLMKSWWNCLNNDLLQAQIPPLTFYIRSGAQSSLL